MKTVAVALMGVAMMAISTSAQAGRDAFHPGPAIPDYGRIATVENEFPLEEGIEFRVAFDVDTQAEVGEINRSLDSAARFINMHVDAGVPAENIHLALVIHGPAPKDMTSNEVYEGLYEVPNANAPLIEVLTAHGVEIYVCGQSAAFHDVSNDDLAPGVTMALSAMTAHAQLQQMGYTLNPF